MKRLPKECYLCKAPTPAELENDWIRDTWGKWLVCPECIREGRAICADHSKQNFDGLGGPINAFWDQERKCVTCDRVYVFTAAEQEFWYETLGFWVESAPVQCPECRRERRKFKRAQRLLQEQLPLPSDSHWQRIEMVAKAAACVGARSALEYLRRAKNQCDDPAEKVRLDAEIAGFQPQTPQKLGYGRGFVEQLELHYRDEASLNRLSEEDQAYALLAAGLPRDRCSLVARIDGMWVHPVPDLKDRQQLAYLHGEHLCPNMPPHEPKVLIDRESGVLIYLPKSNLRGQTGHYRIGDEIYGPPGPLPWV